MKVLVTGGAGFIGSHIVDALCAAGNSVICIDSLDSGVYHYPPSYLRSDVEYHFIDLRNLRADRSFEDVEAIVHLAALGGVTRAAREPLNIIEANALGTARLVDLARNLPHLKKIVLAGSFSVYGSNYKYACPQCLTEGTGDRREEDLQNSRFEVYCPSCQGEMQILPITEDTPPAPLETYGTSKYMQELCFRGFTESPIHILRFSSVYGDRLRLDDGEATIIAKMAGWVRNRQRPKLFEDGRQMRDWVYVSDIVDSALALLNGASAPEIINVCSGVPTRLFEACELLAHTYNVDCPPEVVGGYRLGDMRHCLGDTTSLQKLLGRPPIPFTKGVELAFGSKGTK